MKHLYLLLLWLSTFYVSSAQSLSVPQAYFSALIVENMDSSLNWYTNILQFEVVNQVDLKERGLRQANLSNGETWIELIELSGAIGKAELQESLPPNPRLQGFFKFGFRVNDFDLWKDHFIKHQLIGSSAIVKDPNMGKRMFIIKDPDGNRIQFFEK